MGMALKGARAHIRRLHALASPAMTDAVERALFHAGELVQTEAQLSITRGSVSGRNHVPSSPGEPPNQDSGVLAGNIETTRAGKLRVRVTSKAGYSSALEFGTSKMAARPFMRPARDKMRPQVEKLIADVVQKQVKASRRSD